MHITNYRSGNEKDILELFEMAFKREMSIEYWRWRFETNPAGKYLIKLMWEGDLLIGHYAVSPVVLDIDKRNVKSALSMTTMTHPNHTGKGIFKLLAQKLYQELSQYHDIDLVWGFPNSNSHYGFIKNLSWENIGILNNLEITKDLGGVKDERITYSSIFKDEHVKLLQNTSKNFRVKVKKDRVYLNWRYLENPSNQYKIIELHDKGLKAFVVYKEYHPSGTSQIDINILELACEADYNMLLSIFKHIIFEYNARIGKINLWLSLWDARFILLEKIGFKLSDKNTFIGTYNSSKNLEMTKNLKNWHYSFGDSDVY